MSENASAMPPAQRLREWFLLRKTDARAKSVSPEVRAAAAVLVAKGKQKRDAAEALWVAGCPAEALRLAHEARACGEALAREGATPEPIPEDLPALDNECKEAHGQLLRAALEKHDALVTEHLGSALTTEQVARMRLGRVGAVAAGALFVLVAAVLLLRTKRELRAEASASWDARYTAANAVDGVESTDWVLPDNTVGWIDVKVVPPRKISRIKLMNVRNMPMADRATNELHVTASLQGKPVKAFDGKFEGFSEKPAWLTFEVNERIDRIRVDVRSWYKSGGGLAELQVE